MAIIGDRDTIRYPIDLDSKELISRPQACDSKYLVVLATQPQDELSQGTMKLSIPVVLKMSTESNYLFIRLHLTTLQWRYVSEFCS